MFCALAHDAQAQVRFVDPAACMDVRAHTGAGKTQAVVAHLQPPVRLFAHVQPHLPGARVFAHIRQRFLHDVQHLDLRVRRQRQGLAFHPQSGLQTRLLFKLAQRGPERRFNVFGVGARAKVHQQFAHIAVTFAHADVDLFQHMLHLLHVGLGQRFAHQLNLNLQERE